ncbi:MAG: SURF1 family protein [Actinomycetota bacterium]|nr:SURF1 family protein [Actinomycetota bacterium]
MYRFLLTRRWLALAVVAAVLAVVCARLGWWQLERLAERSDDNAVVEANLDASPVPLQALVDVGAALPAGDEWRQVTMSGRYAPDNQVLVRYQSRNGLRGVDVVVPLLLRDASAVLVDRGFLESPAGTPDLAEVPPPPPGRVTVTGWLRRDSDAPSEATTPIDSTVRAVSSVALADVMPDPLRGGWVQALEESPTATGGALAGPEPPETDSGPHLFYGLQWFFFGLLALVGYGWFAYDEAHPPARRPKEPSQRAQAVLTWPG